MSLVPAERRALARIEYSLSRSDPRLASMLTRFSLPTSRGGRIVTVRRLARLRPFLPAMIAVIVVFLFVVAIVFSPATPSPCSARSEPGFAAVTEQVSGCPPAGHRGHDPGHVAGNGTAS